MALRDFVIPGDVATTERITAKLEQANTLSAGGAEMHIPKHRYKVELILLICKLTKLNCENVDVRKPDDIANFIAETQQWAEQQPKQKIQAVES